MSNPEPSVSVESVVVPDPHAAAPVEAPPSAERAAEFGGRAGPEPTRFGDWERAGRCVDF